MYRLKVILLSLIGISTVLIVALAIIFSSYTNQDYQQLLIKAVDKFSDYTLTIKGSFELNRSFSPILSASAITLQSKTDASNIHIDKFRIQLSLAPLLNNTLLINDLLVENMRAGIQTGEDAKSVANLLSALPVPIIEHAVLKNITLLVDYDEHAYYLDHLQIAINDNQDQLKIQATGKLRANKFNIKGTLSLISDTHKIVEGSFVQQIAEGKAKANYKGNSTIGQARVSSDLFLSFINGKPEITGKISATKLALRDFSADTSQAKQGTTQQDRPLFSQAPILLQPLHKVDLNLRLKIDQLSVGNYKFDKISIDVLLNNGKLSLAPASFNLSGEHVLMTAEVDARSRPEWMVNMSGKNLQLADILGQQKSSQSRKGKLSFVTKLTGTGESLHEIAANLNGSISFVLENETITRSELEIVFLNPMGWFFSKGISANEIQISCGMAQYKAKQGIINSEVFFIDGPKLLIRGKEQINLVNETINSFYNLQKKNILDYSMLPASFDTSVPIKVSGHLANPTVEQAPLDSIESKANRYIFAPVATVPREVLGAVLDIFEDNRKAQHPCNKYLQNN